MILFFWALCGVASAFIALNKGRSGCGWFALGFLLGPFGLLFALIASPDKAELDKRAVAMGESRKCPFCAEIIKREAVVCRFCGKDQPPS